MAIGSHPRLLSPFSRMPILVGKVVAGAPVVPKAATTSCPAVSDLPPERIILMGSVARQGNMRANRVIALLARPWAHPIVLTPWANTTFRHLSVAIT